MDGIEKGMIFHDLDREDYFIIRGVCPDDEDTWDIDSSATPDFPKDGSDGWFVHARLLARLEDGTIQQVESL